jgi:hypothetical protein
LICPVSPSKKIPRSRVLIGARCPKEYPGYSLYVPNGNPLKTGPSLLNTTLEMCPRPGSEHSFVIRSLSDPVGQ